MISRFTAWNKSIPFFEEIIRFTKKQRIMKSPYIWIFILSSIFMCVSCELCKRPGFYCKNGGTVMGGTCRCPPDYHGFDCGLFKPILCAINPCENNGLCYDSGKCYCGCGFYGDRCQYSTESVSCDSYSMTVDLALEVSGDVEVFAMPYPKCVFEIAGHVGGWAVYRLELNRTLARTPECQSAMVESNKNSTPTYTVIARVRQSRGYETPNDWSMKFRCIYASKGTSSVKDVTRDASPLQFAFTDQEGYQIDKIPPGTPFNIVFFLKPNTGYRNVRLEYLAVRNQTSGDKVYTYLEGGAIPTEAQKLGLITDNKQHFEQIAYSPSQNVSSTRLSLTGLNETSLVYMDYRIWVCETEICPDQNKVHPHKFFHQNHPGCDPTRSIQPPSTQLSESLKYSIPPPRAK